MTGNEAAGCSKNRKKFGLLCFLAWIFVSSAPIEACFAFGFVCWTQKSWWGVVMDMPWSVVADDTLRDVYRCLPKPHLARSGRRRVGHGGIPEKVSSCRCARAIVALLM